VTTRSASPTKPRASVCRIQLYLSFYSFSGNPLRLRKHGNGKRAEDEKRLSYYFLHTIIRQVIDTRSDKINQKHS
jgi:hypothetical protein